jgi:excisionase family DNA binding protein
MEVIVHEFTVKEIAARERVTERTVRRWIEKGAVVVRKTPGGGVRVLLTIQQQRTNHDVVRHPSN